MNLIGYSYFPNLFEHDLFTYSIYILFFNEFLIYLFTHLSTRKSGNVKKSDKGSVYLIILGYYTCIYISFYFVSKDVSSYISNLSYPHLFYYIGLILIFTGIIIRDYSVWTLKKAFTFSVQTTSSQHLIQKGFYKYIRNPAYTGSIVSLLGVSFALRNVFAPIVVLIICFICYGIRINVEEKALKQQFKNEFDDYCSKTYRLFPFIW